MPAPENRLTRWSTVARYVLMHVGTALTVVPAWSVLNRIMIAEMQLSSVLVSFLMTLPYWLSPMQIGMGIFMDGWVRNGKSRAMWVIAGGGLAAAACALSAPAAFLIPDTPGMGLLATAGTFLVWGLGINIASVSYLAQLSDQANGARRSRIVGVMYICMISASIATGIFLSRRLEEYSEAQVNSTFLIIALIAFILVLAGAWRIPQSQVQPAAAAPRRGRDSLRILTRNPVALRYFVYLLIVLISIHAQDVLLEPYGGVVMGMDVSQTSRLISYWGAGFLVSMAVSIQLVQHWGERRVVVMGTWVAVAAFVLICAVGLTRNVPAFTGAVVLLGLGAGFMTQSNLAMMLRLTIPESRAVYIGTWSAANFLGQALIVAPVALGTGIGSLAQNDWMGYAGVFLLEAAGLAAALVLLRTVKVKEFRDRALAISLSEEPAV